MLKQKVSKISRKTLIIILIAVLALAGSAFAYRQIADNRNSNRNTGDSGDTQNGINYGPPTEEEQAAGDKQKDELTEEERKQQEGQNQTGQKTVSVIITDAGQYDGIIEVRSFIPGHLQDGTCTITFKNGSQTVVKETPAKKDVSSTICLNPQMKRSEFPKAGTWQVTVSYQAPSAKGTSETRTMSIK